LFLYFHYFPVFLGSKDEFRPLMQVSNEAEVPGDDGQSAETQNKEKLKSWNQYSVRSDSIPDKRSSGHESDSDV
jgi:hypothetical protein